MADTYRDAIAERSRCGGFTFIELLATVVLIGIIMPVAMHCIALCASLGGQARRQIEAASLARTRLTELSVSDDWKTSQKAGDFGEVEFDQKAVKKLKKPPNQE